MAYQEWTVEEIETLERRISVKVARKQKLTHGEDVVWGVLKRGKPLTVRFISEIDDWMGLGEEVECERVCRVKSFIRRLLKREALSETGVWDTAEHMIVECVSSTVVCDGEEKEEKV